MPRFCLLFLLNSFSVNISRCFSNPYRFFGSPDIFQWRGFLTLILHYISRMAYFCSELDIYKFHLMATQLSWGVIAPSLYVLSTSFLILRSFTMSLLVISVFIFSISKRLRVLNLPMPGGCSWVLFILVTLSNSFSILLYLSSYISVTGTAFLLIIYKFGF